jgi:general secretion pathway protein L
MRIVTLLRRWIEVLTGVYFAWCESWRARRSLIISCENDRFIVRRAQPVPDAVTPEQPDASDASTVVSVLADGVPISPDVARAVQGHFIILELPAGDVAMRRISVPAQARDFLPGIVRNQIERLSPWRADQAVYGIDADARVEDPSTLDVCVLIAARAAVDSVCAKLAAIGLTVDRIVTCQRNGASAQSVTLWSRLAAVSRERLDRASRRVAIGLAAVIVLSLGLSLWAVISAASIREESEEVAARTKVLQRQIEGPRTPQSVALLKPGERAWYEKETAPTAAIVLEAVSRALPDTAYLTELRLDHATLRIIGLTADAPALIAPLEHSGHLAEVRFFAPTTRGQGSELFRFHIEARVEPHFRMAGGAP